MGLDSINSDVLHLLTQIETASPAKVILAVWFCLSAIASTGPIDLSPVVPCLCLLTSGVSLYPPTTSPQPCLEVGRMWWGAWHSVCGGSHRIVCQFMGPSC